MFEGENKLKSEGLFGSADQNYYMRLEDLSESEREGHPHNPVD